MGSLVFFLSVSFLVFSYSPPLLLLLLARTGKAATLHLALLLLL